MKGILKEVIMWIELFLNRVALNFLEKRSFLPSPRGPSVGKAIQYHGHFRICTVVSCQPAAGGREGEAASAR